MSSAIHGHGTTLTGGTSGVIAEIMSIGGPDQSSDVVDVSNMDSVTKNREKIAGMIDSGEFTLELNYVKGMAAVLQGILGGTAEVWTIALPGTSSYACSGFVSALGVQIPYDDKVTQSCTITLTGAMTHAVV